MILMLMLSVSAQLLVLYAQFFLKKSVQLLVLAEQMVTIRKSSLLFAGVGWAMVAALPSGSMLGCAPCRSAATSRPSSRTP
jgi:hypothetical protein